MLQPQTADERFKGAGPSMQPRGTPFVTSRVQKGIFCSWCVMLPHRIQGQVTCRYMSCMLSDTQPMVIGELIVV